MNHLDNIVRFLGDLGFVVTRAVKPHPQGFVNGIYCHGMTMLINPGAMLSAGDLLHEAGHVATVPSQFREHMYGNFAVSLTPHMNRYLDEHDILEAEMTGDMVFRGLLQSGETEAIAWSYAAAVAAGIPPRVVFHNAGYDGDGEGLALQLSLGQHFGVHGLHAAKMTTCRMYPKMLRWLQV